MQCLFRCLTRSRRLSSCHKDPIDDTKSSLEISLNYLIQGRFLKPHPLPYVRLSLNGNFLRRLFIQKYKENLIHCGDIILSSKEPLSLSNIAKQMNGSSKRSIFIVPPEGPSDVCHLIKDKEQDNCFSLKYLPTLEEFKIKSYVFMNKNVAWRFAFADVLRERRIWWKKHFFNPSAVFIPEKIESDSKLSAVRISTNFEGQSLGFQENLALETFKMLDDYKEFKILETTVCPAIGAFALLLDGVRERMFLSGRPRLALNTSLVPYQLTLFISQDWVTTSPRTRNDLFELKLFLTKELRKEGIRLYNTPDESLEVADLLGIPSTIILSPKTLEDGICNIWERETCWFEEIHIADIVKRFVWIYQKRDIPSL